jgi:hypothetical protein
MKKLIKTNLIDSGADPDVELVRHYLIERTPTGHIRIKGCPNERDFGMFTEIKFVNSNEILYFSANLSALVYQHTLESLTLPIKLVLPTKDFAEDYHSEQQETEKMSIKDLLEKGAGKNKI